jgi:hypothetical protein
MWVLYNGKEHTPIIIDDQSIFSEFKPYCLRVYGEPIITTNKLDEAKLVGERIQKVIENYMKYTIQHTIKIISQCKSNINHKQ